MPYRRNALRRIRIIMKNVKKIPVLAIVAIIIALSGLFSACNVFSQSVPVRNVEIFAANAGELSDGDGDGTYEAAIGKSFELVVRWKQGGGDAKDIKWFVEYGGEKTQIDGATGKTLLYTADGVGKYGFYASVNGVECTKAFSVEANYAALSQVRLSCEAFEAVDGVIQMSPTDNTDDVAFIAEPIYDGGRNPLSELSYEWTATGARIESDGAAATVSFDKGANALIKVFATETEAGQIVATAEAEIEIMFVERYDALDDIKLGVKTGAAAVDGKSYYLCDTSGVSAREITVAASALPVSSDLKAEANWEIRNSDGISASENKGRQIVLALAYGKNVITCKIDNVMSEQLTVYVLTAEDYAARKSAMDYEFAWYGGVYSAYLADSTDVNAFIAYTSSLCKNDVKYSFFIQPGGLSSRSYFDECVSAALNKSVDDAGNYSLGHSFNERWIAYGAKSYYGSAQGAAATDYTVTQSKDGAPVAVENENKREKLPVDDFDREMTVRSSNELYRALGWGYRPVFENNAAGDRLRAVYEKAREVLLSFIPEGADDFEKTLAIYQWIVSDVDYDYRAAELAGSADMPLSDVININAFYIEGVFEDGRAVCDGKSKAFALMCGMEGITAVRISGYAGMGGVREKHAWNKVLIDGDGNGVKEWYVVDTTWGDGGNMNGKSVTEYITWEYFLTTDEAIGDTHIADDNPLINDVTGDAVTKINVYDKLTVDGKSRYVTDSLKFVYMQQYAVEAGLKTLSVKLDITGFSSQEQALKKYVIAEADSYIMGEDDTFTLLFK